MIRAVFLAGLLACAGTSAAQDSVSVREQQLQEVVVSANTAQRRIGSVQIGAEQVQVNELAAMPALFGEHDIIRSVQLLPGVKAESDASSSFQVRGGTAAQNMMLYDQAPVYNVSHLAGLFSAFNDDALASATLYKGLVPAQYGGASSAVFDLTTRTGDLTDWHGGLSLGLLSAKGLLEGPLAKGKSSLLVAARRSYADLFLKQVPDFKGNSLYFYDTNVKLDCQLGARDQLFLSLFVSHDKTALKDMVDLQWGNLAASLNWLHHYRNHGTSQTTLLYSDYTMDNSVDLLGMNLSFSGHIRHTGLRQNFRLTRRRHEWNLGAQSMLMDVKSAEWQNVNQHEREQRKAWENSLWVGDVFTAAPWMTLSAGLRLQAFSMLGGPYYYEISPQGDIAWLYTTRRNRIVKTHVTLDPRVSLVLRPAERLSIKAGYSRTTQNLHALRNQSTSTPFDRYTLSSNLLRPQRADQLSLGLYAMTPRQDYDCSLEGYYRHVSHVLDYRDGKSFSSAIEIERLVLPGEGRGYGAEFCLRKNSGRLTGWLAYTLSWSENRIAGINGDRWYAANNDRRHDVDIVATYRLSPTWTLNALWVYNSGQAFTAPSGKYEVVDNYIYYYAERNGYRAPSYHRLDVSATWRKPVAHGRWTREWVFGIYNLYNRYNPFLINFEDSQHGARTKAVQYSLFGIVPSVAFNLQF